MVNSTNGTHAASHAGTPDPSTYQTTVQLSNGTVLYTRQRPEAWEALLARAMTTPHEADSAWIDLYDGRRVLVQVRHVALVEPKPGWKPKAAKKVGSKLGTDDEGASYFSPE